MIGSLRSFIVVLVAVANLAVLDAAQAGRRIALVIGNGAYTSVSPLENPPRDAALMAQALQETGFEVTKHLNVDSIGMNRAILQFGRDLRAAGTDAVGLFYYAGHGVQADGANFLIPIGTDIQDQAELSVLAVNMNWVLGQMEAAGNDINMIVLDACRNNPFKSQFRSTSRGLAQIDAPRGSFIAYATAPGAVAEDGSGDNSAFSQALARHIKTPGLPVESVFKRVRASVIDATSNRQLPWQASSLTGDFYFVPPQVAALTPGVEGAGAASGAASLTDTPQPATAGTRDSDQTERLYYESAIQIQDPAAKKQALQAYVDKYGQSGQFTTLAEIQLSTLEQSAAAESAPRTTDPAADQGAGETQVAALPDQALPDAPKQPAADDPEAIEAALNLTRAQRRLIQESLTALGHDTHGVDGALGNNSRQAITEWQVIAGYAPTGYLTAPQHGQLLATAKPAVEAARAAKRQAAAAAMAVDRDDNGETGSAGSAGTRGDTQTASAGASATSGSGATTAAPAEPQVAVMNLTSTYLNPNEVNHLISAVKSGLGPHWKSITGVQLQVTDSSARTQVQQAQPDVGAALMGGLIGGALGANLTAQSMNRPATTVTIHSASVTAIVQTRDKGTVTETAIIEQYDQTGQPGLASRVVQQAAQNAIAKASTRMAGGTPQPGLSRRVIGQPQATGSASGSSGGGTSFQRSNNK